MPSFFGSKKVSSASRSSSSSSSSGAPPPEATTSTSTPPPTTKPEVLQVPATKEPAPMPATSQTLDIAFCCDCTGSMGSYIRSAQENIRTIAATIHARVGQSASVRYALVKYRDHPPQDRTFVTEVFPFTDNIDMMQKFVDTMSASGGGDGPEAVAAALHELNALDWRPNATKVSVLISDAPPHGLGESGDGFPQGCPLGYDPVKICKQLAAKSITVYAVGVEPVISTSFKFARDFMMMVAQITEGKYLPLGKASILSDVVVNGALEGANMKALWEKLEKEAVAEAQAAGITLDEAQLVAATEVRLEAQKSQVQMAQVEVANPYMKDYDNHNVDCMMAASSFSEARSRLDSNRNAQVAQTSAGYAWGAQQAECREATMAPQQACRMAAKAKKSRGMWSYS